MDETAGKPAQGSMTPWDLKRWRFDMRLNQAAAAEALGLSHRTITAYEIGEYPIPLAVAYACLWLEAISGEEAPRP
jgi:DNA-binding XRE family transcriptional regulator